MSTLENRCTDVIKMKFAFILLLVCTTHLFLLNGSSEAFYIPGVAPVEFHQGSPVDIKAVKMTSSMTQLPYDYYALNFCQPKGGTVYKTENLGEILRGDRIVNTPFDVKMRVDEPCKMLCNSVSSPMVWTEDNSRLAIDMINHDYYVHLIVDNLPGATKINLFDPEETGYERGYKLGFVKNNVPLIYNHLNLVLSYHSENGKDSKIVRFEIEPKSVSLSDMKGDENSCTLPENFSAQRLNPTGNYFN